MQITSLVSMHCVACVLCKVVAFANYGGRLWWPLLAHSRWVNSTPGAWRRGGMRGRGREKATCPSPTTEHACVFYSTPSLGMGWLVIERAKT